MEQFCFHLLLQIPRSNRSSSDPCLLEVNHGSAGLIVKLTCGNWCGRHPISLSSTMVGRYARFDPQPPDPCNPNQLKIPHAHGHSFLMICYRRNTSPLCPRLKLPPVNMTDQRIFQILGEESTFFNSSICIWSGDFLYVSIGLGMCVTTGFETMS